MNHVDDTELYTIGELARRTGLTVKTIRFYSDSGVVPPTDRTTSGYRLYDAEAMGRLELVRTLRELDVGLEEIREFLGDRRTPGQLARTHLTLLEGRMRLLRTRRAVLRAIVKQDSTTEEVRLMNELASMSDEERDRIIDEFWDATTAGIDVNPEFVAWMRSAKPNLPSDPSTEQVEAWIELAELVSDPGFRELVRELNVEQAAARERDTSAGEPDRSWQQRTERDPELWAEINAAHAAGNAPESTTGLALATRFAQAYAEDRGEHDRPEARNTAADAFDDHDPRLTRYWELLGTINGWDMSRTLSSGATKWFAAALRASVDRDSSS